MDRQRPIRTRHLEGYPSYEYSEPLTLSSSQVMSSIPENCLIGYLNDFSRARSILSQLHLCVSSSSAESSLPFTDCDHGTNHSPYSPTASSTEVYPLFPLPQPLTAELIALGLSPTTAQYLSGAYMKAATRLKARLETALHRADYACTEIKFPEGFETPQSQPHIRAIYASHYKQTVKSWIEIGMLSTRQCLLITSLKNRLRTSLARLRPVYSKEEDSGPLPHTDRTSIEAEVVDISYKMKSSLPPISIGMKTKQCAGLTTRPFTGSSCCHGTPDQTILEPTRPARVIKADPDAGLKSAESAAIKVAKSQGFVGTNHFPTCWDLTSFIHDFDGLSIRDRSKSVGLKGEDDTCKAAPSGHIFTLSKHPSTPVIRLPTPAGVQSKTSSSRPRSSLQSSYDIHSHSSSLQSARRRKIAPCPNRDRSTQSTYKGPDVFFSRQTNDMTITSSAANAKETSDSTYRCLSPSASAHSRRRKIAPLPPRYPSMNTIALAVTVSSDIHLSSQTASLVPTANRHHSSEMLVRLNRPLPRSPSLTSLSSNESDRSSSDDLETPPSSPVPSSTILPTFLSTHSVSPQKYGLLPFTFASLDRGLSTWSLRPRVGIPTRFPSPRPDIFSSVCVEDFSHFTSSR
uniref:A2 mating type protein n=1 Tax=Heterobasidion annosum TaxID=13563 RepID=S5RF01_HETAN|nr:a2 mating type protein [Heterobasidion annosum]